MERKYLNGVRNVELALRVFATLNVCDNNIDGLIIIWSPFHHEPNDHQNW